MSKRLAIHGETFRIESALLFLAISHDAFSVVCVFTVHSGTDLALIVFVSCLAISSGWSLT
jgi:hypothetical protein